MEWWIQLNKKIGYNRISFCNHSIDADFNKMFEKYSNFLDISPLKCIPNLQNKSESKYYSQFFDLKKDQDQLVDVLKIDIFQ